MNIVEYLDGYKDWTADEIANILRWQNIRGVKACGINCPIGNEARKLCGLRSFIIQKNRVDIFNGFGDLSIFYMPPSIREFIENFDSGKYPYLIK